MTRYGVILFPTTAAVMRAEKLLKQKGFTTRLIPVPRHLSSDCGISLRFDWAKRAEVAAEIEAIKLENAGIHEIPEE